MGSLTRKINAIRKAKKEKIAANRIKKNLKESKKNKNV